MFTTKMWLFYGFSAIATLIIFSLIGVTIWKGYVVFGLGGLYINYFDKLKGLIVTNNVEGSKEVEDGLGY